MKSVAGVISAARRERGDPAAKDRVRRALAVSLAGASALTTTSAAASTNGIAVGGTSALTMTKLISVMAVVASVSGGAVWLAGTRHEQRALPSAETATAQREEDAPVTSVATATETPPATDDARPAPPAALANDDAGPTPTAASANEDARPSPTAVPAKLAKPARHVERPTQPKPALVTTTPTNAATIAPQDNFAAELAALDAAQAALRDHDYARADALAKASLATSPKTPFAHELLFVRAVAACGLGISNPHLATLAALDAKLHARAVSHCKTSEGK